MQMFGILLERVMEGELVLLLGVVLWYELLFVERRTTTALLVELLV